MPEGRRPRGVPPRPRSGAAAKSTRLRRCRHRREELPRVQDTHVSEVRSGDGRSHPMPLSPRPGALAGRTNPTSKERWLRGPRRA